MAPKPKVEMKEAKANTLSATVAVVVRTFNRRDRVLRAIESVKRQTYTSRRLIVIDDGSTDGTRELLQQRPDLEYHWQRNQGTWAAMTAGLRYAANEYVAFLDSDDEWDVDYLENCVRLLENHDVGFVFSNYRSRDGDRELRGLFEGTPLVRKLMSEMPDQTIRTLSPKETRMLFVRYIPAPTSAIFARRALIQPTWIGTTKAPAEDWNIILRMIFDHSASSVMETTQRWTKWVHGGNIADGQADSTTFCLLHEDSRKFMIRNYGSQMTRVERNFIAQELATLCFECAYGLASKGQISRSLQFYAKSLRYKPRIRTLIAGGKSLLRYIWRAPSKGL